jgi:predicted ferric reductase
MSAFILYLCCPVQIAVLRLTASPSIQFCLLCIRLRNGKKLQGSIWIVEPAAAAAAAAAAAVVVVVVVVLLVVERIMYKNFRPTEPRAFLKL